MIINLWQEELIIMPVTIDYETLKLCFQFENRNLGLKPNQINILLFAMI